MAVQRLIDDLEVIQKLGNSPGVDDGLTTAEFKAKFDYAAQVIKDYLNNTIAVAIDAINAGAVSLSPTKPLFYPVLWFNNSTGAVKMIYIDDNGDQTEISPAVTTESVSGLSEALDDLRTDLENMISNLSAVTVELLAANWSASAPYYQVVTLPGITSEWKAGTPTAVYTGSTENKIAIQDSLFCIGEITSGESTLTFTCFEDKPEKNLTLVIPRVPI